MIKHFLATLPVLFLLIGCQKEYVEIEEPDKSVTISSIDPVADLILKVTLKDGSYDNIIDRCSEISINFPYYIQVNEEVLYISSQEEIENLKLVYYQYRDDIEIIYPVKVTFSDYSEGILSNEDDLEIIQEQYNSSLIDDDIECIDFVYPIELSLYNDKKQSLDVVNANNDSELYNVFANIDELLIDISFPIELKLTDGQIVSISNNIQLEEQIENTMNSCDENDDVEFDDDDYPYEDLITAQNWSVTLYADTTNETTSFDGYVFSFKPDYTVQVETGIGVVYGDWEVVIDAVPILEIEFDTDDEPFIWLNAGWEIKNINSESIEMQAESDNEGYTKKLNFSIAH